MKKLAVLSALLLLIGIAASVHLWMQVKEVNPSYHKVTVTVSEVQVIPPSFSKRYTEYIVKARVNGTEKQIHNIRKGFSYYVGKQLEVLEAGGELYEDESGVKTNTKAAQYYFISLGANLFLLALFLSSFLSYRKKRKQEIQRYDDLDVFY